MLPNYLPLFRLLRFIHHHATQRLSARAHANNHPPPHDAPLNQRQQLVRSSAGTEKWARTRRRCAAIKVYAISSWRSTFLRRPFLCRAITIPRPPSITRGSTVARSPEVGWRMMCNWSGCCGIYWADWIHPRPLPPVIHPSPGRSASPASFTTTTRIMQLTYGSHPLSLSIDTGTLN